MKMYSSLSLTRIAIISVVVIAFAVRFLQLNSIPAGYYWDEASIVYNAWSISEWHRDENANFMPLSFQAFGEHKAPVIIYALASLYKILGLHIVLVRVLTAASGVLAVVLLMDISRRLFRNYFPSDWYVVLIGLLAALSPWWWPLSRVGFEANLALFFFLLSFWLFLLPRGRWVLVVSSVSLVVSVYTYHGFKIFAPFFVGLSAFLFPHRFKRVFKQKYFLGFLYITLLLPLVWSAITGSSLERGKSLVLFESGELVSYSEVVLRIVENIGLYFSQDFWLQGKDFVPNRHIVEGYGVIYLSQLLMFIVGIWYWLKRHKKMLLWIIVWIVLGMLPAIVSVGNPHALRSLNAVVPIILLSGTGWSVLFDKTRRWRRYAGVVLLCLFFFESSRLIQYYFTDYRTVSAHAFQYGYERAIEVANDVGMSRDKIVMTDHYGQPYIYTLLYSKITPQEYLWGGLNNYEFRSIQWPEGQSGALYIGSPEEIPINDAAVIEVIHAPDSDDPMFIIADVP